MKFPYVRHPLTIILCISLIAKYSQQSVEARIKSRKIDILVNGLNNTGQVKDTFNYDFDLDSLETKSVIITKHFPTVKTDTFYANITLFDSKILSYDVQDYTPSDCSSCINKKISIEIQPLKPNGGVNITYQYNETNFFLYENQYYLKDYIISPNTSQSGIMVNETYPTSMKLVLENFPKKLNCNDLQQKCVAFRMSKLDKSTSTTEMSNYEFYLENTFSENLFKIKLKSSDEPQYPNKRLLTNKPTTNYIIIINGEKVERNSKSNPNFLRKDSINLENESKQQHRNEISNSNNDIEKKTATIYFIDNVLKYNTLEFVICGLYLLCLLYFCSQCCLRDEKEIEGKISSNFNESDYH